MRYFPLRDFQIKWFKVKVSTNYFQIKFYLELFPMKILLKLKTARKLFSPLSFVYEKLENHLSFPLNLDSTTEKERKGKEELTQSRD